jgi:hypothetical protein
MTSTTLPAVVRHGLSAGSVAAVLALGLVALPPDRIVSPDYAADTAVVLRAMAFRLVDHTAEVLLPWLLPIPVAMFVPLRWTDWPLRIASLALAGIAWAAVVASRQERAHVVAFLRDDRTAGYLWHEALLFTAATALASPLRPLALATPFTAVMWSRPGEVTHGRRLLLLLAALASSALVVSTVAPFVSADGRNFYLTGTSSYSGAVNAVTVGFVLSWVRVYHLLCHDALRLLRRGTWVWIVAGGAVAVGGTAAVLVWVSAAWAVHLMVTMRVEDGARGR